MRNLLTVIMVWVFAHTIYSQKYELYIGGTSNEDTELGIGYMAGFNFIIKANENREWANRILIGVEHSGFYSGKINIANKSSDNIIKNCNECEITIYSIPSDKKELLKYTRGVSLNFGIEAYKGLFLTTGITTYNHIAEINNIKIYDYGTFYIDAGAKYYIKHNRWYFIPTFKFNPEVTSFGLGISWE